jgi:tetratricopeptide (TPR) repeat protein
MVRSIWFISFLFIILCSTQTHAESDLGSARQFIKKGEYQEAERSLKKITKHEPSNEEAWVLLGDSYVGMEKDKKAVTAYEQALRLDPKNEAACLGLGNAYQLMKNYSYAVEAYKRVIELNPKHAEAHYRLGLTYDRLAMLTQAFEEYNILKTIDEHLAQKLYHTILGK